MRIGVFCPNWVGDGVMALPFLNALRRANPNAAIIIICKSWVAPIFENHPSINGMISFAKKDLTGFRATSNAGRSLKALDLDQFFYCPILIVLPSWLKSQRQNIALATRGRDGPPC